VSFVLVHGLASNLRLWDGVRDALVARGHRVVALDLRGHGAHSPKPDGGYDVPTVAGDVAALISSLGLSRPVVAGQSWGGHVALELAASWPGLVGAVALVDGGWTHRSTELPWDEVVAQYAPPRFAGLRVDEVEAGFRAARVGWPPFALPAAMASFEVRDDGTVAPWLTFDRHLQVLRGMWEHRPASLYGEVDVPALLVACENGSASTAWKHAAVAEAAAALADCRVRWVDAHHDVHAQHPDLVAELLSELACVRSS
jgi:pimeloyl-ACP methyl ester carboxylesterase